MRHLLQNTQLLSMPMPILHLAHLREENKWILPFKISCACRKVLHFQKKKKKNYLEIPNRIIATTKDTKQIKINKTIRCHCALILKYNNFF